MPPAILGKKIGMTQAYTADGKIIPVTVIQAGPCVVLRVKSATPAPGKTSGDGYDAIQIGYDEKPLKAARLSEQGEALKAGTTPKRFIREIRFHPNRDGKPSNKPGDTITVDQFVKKAESADAKDSVLVGYVDVVATSKGKGFQGVMKRHHFGGQPASHGTERKHRSPGSIGGMAPGAPGRGIKKGKRMSGHMGDVRVTSRGHEVIGADHANNLLIIQGSIPGANGTYVMVRECKTRRGPKAAPKVVEGKAKGKTVAAVKAAKK
jgi:large subunit ribosomal protein L3